MSDKENKDRWEFLPNFVALNPRRSAMFEDSLSGLYLTQWGGEDEEGNELRPWGHVPKERDCSRIKMALDVNNLFPCNPKGESRYLPPPIFKASDLETLMEHNSRELVAMLPHISDATLLSRMRKFEEGKSRKDQRTTLIQEIATRMKDRDIGGVTDIKSQPAMIKDADGELVPDKVQIR